MRDGSAVVSTTAFMATPDDESRGVRAATVFVLPNRGRLAELVCLVDAEAAAGRISGTVVVLAG